MLPGITDNSSTISKAQVAQVLVALQRDTLCLVSGGL
jgi:hypothetical protein